MYYHLKTALIEDHTAYYLPKVEIKDCNDMIDGRNFFDPPINNNIKTYENTIKIVTGQGYDCTNGYFLDYPYFKDNYKAIPTDLSKHQAPYADPRTIQQINFTRNLDQAEGAFMVLVLEDAKETILDFSQRTVRIL